jgi:hypothetical protein
MSARSFLVRARRPDVVGFALVLLAGTALRLWTATLGHNFDLRSWWIAAELVERGENVWVGTARVPYGPIWPGIAWAALRALRVFGLGTIENFHVAVAGVLSAADVAIALLLRRLLGPVPAALFFLCPISILISGYHAQIDNLAICLALGSWVVWQGARGEPSTARTVAAGTLLGLSLATKHVFAFFPFWVLASPRLAPRTRLLYGGVAYAVFAATFVPFVLRPEGLEGVLTNVFSYRGYEWYGNALLPRLMPWQALWQPLFVGGLLLLGVHVVRVREESALLLYPAALVLLSPTLTNQYLAVPLVTCAAYWRHPATWVYVLAGSVALLGSPYNVGTVAALKAFADQAERLALVVEPTLRSTLLPQLALAFFFATRARFGAQPLASP